MQRGLSAIQLNYTQLKHLYAVLTVWSRRDELKTIIEPDDSLLDELYSRKALSAKECDQIRRKTDVYERNEKLLEYMDRSDDNIRMLIWALKKTDQQHVVNVIKKYQGNY